MAGLQAKRVSARTELHRRLAVPCRRHRGDEPPADVTARTDLNLVSSGGLEGGGDGYAERFGDSPRLTFLASENQPQRNDVYAFEADLAYRVRTVEPRHGVTVSAAADRLSTTEAARYTLPGAA